MDKLYEISIIKMRRVIQLACREIICREQIANCMYECIAEAVEDYLYECRVEQEDE